MRKNKTNQTGTLNRHILKACAFIKSFLQDDPKTGLIIGSGLGRLTDIVNVSAKIPYRDIPHFPESSVSFHASQWLHGKINNVPIIVMNGRYHYYEGLAMRQITLPIRVLKNLGIENLIITHAAGSINPSLKPGTLAVVTDHINMMGDNPLIGEYNTFMGERFTDMSDAYSPELLKKLLSCSDAAIPKTVFAGLSGPSLPSNAEISALQKFGIDTIGMSVVPEVLTARQLNMNVIALTAVTDQTLPGTQLQKVDKKMVSQNAQKLVKQLSELIGKLLKII